MPDSLPLTATQSESLLAETFVRSIEQHEEIGSTNDRALELCREKLPLSPCLILAERQSKGRGRGTNRWWSATGALTFSLVLEDLLAHLPPAVRPQLSLITGLAVCEAIREVMAGQLDRSSPHPPVALKWPNDVYLGEKKVCGILVEIPSLRPDVLVIGVGVNVNNSFANAPTELQATATALIDHCGERLDMAKILISILRRLEAELMQLTGQLTDPFGGMAARFREFCLLTGRRVTHDAAGTATSGICRGIDDDGGLLIETATGVRKFHGGVLTSFQRRV